MLVLTSWNMKVILQLWIFFLMYYFDSFPLVSLFFFWPFYYRRLRMVLSNLSFLFSIYISCSTLWKSFQLYLLIFPQGFIYVIWFLISKSTLLFSECSFYGTLFMFHSSNSFLFFFFFFFKFYFIFKIYINLLFLPNIKMNTPQV